MDAAEVGQILLSLHCRPLFEEGLFERFWIAFWTHGSVGNDDAAKMAKGKAVSGDALLFFAGKTDCLRGVEIAMLVEGPVDQLLEMLERIAVFEIGVEHAVGEDDVGLARG